MSPARPTPLGAHIDALGRRLRAAGPAPRGLPHFWLEHASGTGAHLLDRLSAHGIFRKYEHVLDLGGELGAVGRWLAARLACTAVCTSASLDGAASGLLLTRRAGREGSVYHLPVAEEALPLGTATFTHVWAVETLSRMQRPDLALSEAFRVLRPGGHVALQELVCPARSLVIDGARFTTEGERARLVREVGFVEVTTRDVTTEAPERSARVGAAREQLERVLGDDPAARERRALGAALEGGRLRVSHILARRP